MKRIWPLITLLLAVSLFISCGDSPSGPETPPTPSVLIVVFTGDTLCQTTVTWTICPDENFEAYSLYRSHLPGISANPDSAEVLVVNIDVDERTYIDEDLDWGFTYYYAVRTGNSENQYSWSNEITILTPDDPVIPTVQDLALSPQSSGRSIVLNWSSLPDVEGYKIYFRETSGGTWEEVGDVTTATYTHTASFAGYYSVRAYNGVDFSENYSTPVSTIPSIITTVYTIYDNYSSAGFHDGFIFGPTSGTTGQASQPGFVQDIYAYDLSKGDYDIWLFSGSYYTFGDGNPTYMADPFGTYGYCNQYGTGTWHESYQLFTSDSAVFCALPYTSGDFYYVKMFDLDIAPEPNSQHGTMVSFRYEYQTIPNVTVFTNNF